MKKLFISTILTFIVVTLFSQEIIPNGSFEKIYFNPWPFDPPTIKEWFNPSINNSSSPDFFSGPRPKRPKAAKAFTGRGMAGIILFNEQTYNYREYISVKLTSALEIGKSYEVSFWVACFFEQTKMNPGYPGDLYYGKYFLDSIGFTLSQTDPRQEGFGLIETGCFYEMEIDEESLKGWTKVRAVINPEKEAEYITIGNFKDDTSFKKEIVEFGIKSYAYCFIDDVDIVPVNSNGGLPPLDCKPEKTEIGNTSYLVASEKIDKSKKRKQKTIFFDTLAVNEIFVLEDLIFEEDSFQIIESHHSILNALAIYLSKNPDLKIEIGGHTNTLCDEPYCKELSDKRAAAVKKYLINTREIRPSQLLSKGYGKSMSSIKKRKLDQRVELKILDAK